MEQVSPTAAWACPRPWSRVAEPLASVAGASRRIVRDSLRPGNNGFALQRGHSGSGCSPGWHSGRVRFLDRSLSRLPRPLRTLIDWGLTVALAGAAVLLFQAEVAKPYRIPSPSMEPTLHCAQPATGCKSRVSDRVIANRLVYRFHDPRRGDIIVFKAPAHVEAACNVGGTFIKRLVGLPGETVSMRNGYALPPARLPGTRKRRLGAHSKRGVLRSRRQPGDVVRLAPLGRRSSRQHHRPRGGDLLAAEPGRAAVAPTRVV